MKLLPLLELIFHKVLEMSFLSSIVIVAVLLVRLAFKRLPKIFSYMLWGIVLFRLLCPVSINSAFSAFQFLKLPVQEAQTEHLNGQALTTQEVGNEFGEANIATTEQMAEIDKKFDTIPMSEKSRKSLVQLENTFALTLWLVGVAFMTGYGVISMLQLRKKLVGAIRQKENIFQSDYITVPFVMGIFKPSIYLPSALQQEEKEYIILHEQIHIKRGDHIWRLFAFGALVLHWFNPLVWAAFFLSGRDMEMSCDESVMKKSKADVRENYSTSLLNMASGKRLGDVWTSFEGGNVKNRIQNIFAYKKPAKSMVLVAVLVIFALFFTMGCNSEDSIETENTVTVTERTDAEEPSAEQDISNELSKKAAEELPQEEAGEQDTFTAEEYDSQRENIDMEHWAETWAIAFCGRDGWTIGAMSTPKLREQLAEELLLWRRSFGWSSPWPWPWADRTDYYTVVEQTDTEAVILYYAWVSDPHVTVWRETLKVAKTTAGGLRVGEEQLTYLEDIDTYEKYMQAYPNGIAGTPMDYVTNGAGEVIHQQATDAENEYAYVYTCWLSPETAVVAQLNLLDDSAIVKVNAGKQKADGSVPVTITFVESGDEVSLTMIQPYGKDSIWVVQD